MLDCFIGRSHLSIYVKLGLVFGTTKQMSDGKEVDESDMLTLEDNINFALRARLRLSSRVNILLYLLPYHLIFDVYHLIFRKHQRISMCSQS